MSSGKFSRGGATFRGTAAQYKCCVYTDAELAGEGICATNAYHTQAASTALARLHGNATVSTDGADFSVIKVLLYT